MNATADINKNFIIYHRELLVKEDGCLKKLGDLLVNQKLAITLERIAHDPTSFYNGNLAEDIVNDMLTNQGIITKDDLNEYNVEVEPALQATVGDLELYTTGLPSSGILIAFMLNVLKGWQNIKHAKFCSNFFSSSH